MYSWVCVIASNYCRWSRTPWLLALILTHIFEKDLDKRLDKAEVLLISTIRVALPGSFAKLICKMWVRIRALAMGSVRFSARGVFLTTQLLSTGIGIMRLVQTGMLVLALLSLLIDLIATIATYFLLIDRKARMLQENEKTPIKK